MTPEIVESFRVLEIAPGSPPEVVKRAYRHLAKVWHPDRFPHDTVRRREAQERFKEINRAYQRILDYQADPSGSRGGASARPHARGHTGGTRRHGSGASSESRRTGESHGSRRDAGGGPRRSPEVERLRQLAFQGYPLAQNFLGLRYYKGEGVEQNWAEAKRCFRWAALKGLAKAQFNLGMMHHLGHGGPRNDLEAVRWLQRAADKGFAKAQINLGKMYLHGYGVPRDSRKAEFYFRCAFEGTSVQGTDGRGRGGRLKRWMGLGEAPAWTLGRVLLALASLWVILLLNHREAIRLTPFGDSSLSDAHGTPWGWGIVVFLVLINGGLFFVPLPRRRAAG